MGRSSSKSCLNVVRRIYAGSVNGSLHQTQNRINTFGWLSCITDLWNFLFCFGEITYHVAVRSNCGVRHDRSRMVVKNKHSCLLVLFFLSREMKLSVFVLLIVKQVKYTRKDKEKSSAWMYCARVSNWRHKKTGVWWIVECCGGDVSYKMVEGKVRFECSKEIPGCRWGCTLLHEM